MIRFLQRRWLFFSLLLAAVIVEYISRVAAAPGPTLALVRNPFAAIAAATVFCRYFIHDLRGRTRRWIVYLTPLTWLTALLIEGRSAPPLLLWLDMLFGLGVLGVLGFVVAAVASPASEARSAHIDGLTDALLVPLGASMVSYGLWSTSQLNPVFDTRIYAFEETLGVQFSVLGVMSYRFLSPLSAGATACYNLLAVGTILVALMQPHRDRERDVLAAVVAAGACGFALYFICPVVGPLTAFAPIYPAALPGISPGSELITAAVGPPRNGMPSLHTVWALLIWFNSRPLPSIARRALKTFSLLTMWAVMGLDDTHWLMDVVVAVPLAVGVQAAFVGNDCEVRQRNWTTVLMGAGLTAVWLMAFRLGAPLPALPPVLAWIAVAGTVYWPLRRWHISGEAGSRDARTPIRRRLTRELGLDGP